VKKSRIIIITVIITLVVIFGAKFALEAGNNKPDEGMIVRIEEVKRGELIEFVSAPGEIEPKTKVEISAKVSARVIELPYEEGDTVTCGDPDAETPIPASVLVRLDSKDLESQLVSAEAGRAAQAAQIKVEEARIASQRSSLAGLAASVAQAQRDLKRQKELLDSQDVSQAAFDQARLKLDDLQAQYGAAKHTLKSAELNLVVLQHNLEAADARIAQAREALSHTVISSPIDGIVTRLNAEVGEMVMTGTMNNPGTVIIEVADLSTMLLVAQVDEADIGKLEVGQEAVVRVQAFWNEEFKGVVDTIALTHNVSQNRAKYFRTEILLKGDVEKLYSGLTADVDIYTKKHSGVIKVPSQAVLSRKVDDLPLDIRDNNPIVDPNKSDVYVVYRCIDDKTVVSPVEIGPSDMTHVIIKSGISEGDKIVVGPYKILEGLKHDQKIRDERQVEAEKKKKEEEKKKDDGDKAEPNEQDSKENDSK
jgi:HlyD family secretion protein